MAACSYLSVSSTSRMGKVKMSDTREFHIGDILSITTGRLLSKEGMDGIYEIMGFLSGEDGISTIGLLTFRDHATDVLLTQFPHLKDIVVPESVNSSESADVFLLEMEKKYGAMHTVKR